MTTTKWLAAAALVTATIATPALAQDFRGDRGFNNGYASNDGFRRNGNTGFFPVDIAAGVVGGAIGTAGAIAAAPFGGFDNGYDDGFSSNAGFGFDDSNASFGNDANFGFGNGIGNNGWDRSSNNNFNDSFASQDDGFTTPPRTRRQARANTPGVNPLNNGSNAINQSASYAERNGFVCTPGTYYKNISGRQALCQ